MPGLGELLILVGIPACLGLWIWMIVDCALHEPPGTTRTVWVLIVCLTFTVGALAYLIVRRPQRARGTR